jgi:hypothetical protein
LFPRAWRRGDGDRTAEPELYKDKIEVSLDGRQILPFSAAVAACLVFVLRVGCRLEARAHVDRAAVTSATAIRWRR